MRVARITLKAKNWLKLAPSNYDDCRTLEDIHSAIGAGEAQSEEHVGLEGGGAVTVRNRNHMEDDYRKPRAVYIPL